MRKVFVIFLIICSSSASLNAEIRINTIQHPHYGLMDGTIEVVANGDAGPFVIALIGSDQSYTIQEGMVNFSDLGAGDYQVIVTDRFGCETVLQTSLIESACFLLFELISVKHESFCDDYAQCSGNFKSSCARDGKIEFSLEAPNPYKVLLNGEYKGYNVKVLDRLSQGTYTIRLEVDDDCYVEKEINIVSCETRFYKDIDSNKNNNCELYYTDNQQNRVNTENNVVVKGSMVGACDGSLSLTFYGDQSLFSFYWLTPDQEKVYREDLVDLCPGEYRLYIDNGCEALFSVPYVIPECPNRDFLVDISQRSGTSICGGDNEIEIFVRYPGYYNPSISQQYKVRVFNAFSNEIVKEITSDQNTIIVDKLANLNYNVIVSDLCNHSISSIVSFENNCPRLGWNDIIYWHQPVCQSIIFYLQNEEEFISNGCTLTLSVNGDFGSSRSVLGQELISNGRNIFYFSDYNNENLSIVIEYAGCIYEINVDYSCTGQPDFDPLDEYIDFVQLWLGNNPKDDACPACVTCDREERIESGCTYQTFCYDGDNNILGIQGPFGTDELIPCLLTYDDALNCTSVGLYCRMTNTFVDMSSIMNEIIQCDDLKDLSNVPLCEQLSDWTN